MMIFFLALFSNVFLITIEIGVLAFIVTIIVIVIAVIIKIIKNKKLENTKS
jgi:hypothetical protein